MLFAPQGDACKGTLMQGYDYILVAFSLNTKKIPIFL